MTIDDDLEKVKNANREVRRAVREGNIGLGVDAEQKINKVLMHVEKYEKGLMSEVEGARSELGDAIDKFQDVRDLATDEKHQVEEMEERWARINTYLRFLEKKTQSIEESHTSDDVDSDVDLPIDIDNLNAGREPFAYTEMDLSGWHSTLYGLNGVEEDLNHIIENSLKPLAGELEEEDNEIHEVLIEVTEALEEVAELHEDLLEVRYILSEAEEDEQLEKQIAEKNANQKLKDDIEDAYTTTVNEDEVLDQIKREEKQMFKQMKEVHEMIKSHTNVDQTFIQRINKDIGELKWFNLKSTGLVKSINKISRKSEDLDRELETLIENFNRVKELTQQVIERKKEGKTDEDKILEEIEEYLSKLDEE
ncbi:hypothetical protein GLT90_02060 [Nanohaloarchaea archaeon H12]|jgi:chromosome segregation ATPase|nr:hypothetical protein [Nanohaloarchaea archaeon H12]